jgi:hypothetical protein
MRFLLISSTAILGIAWGGLVPATAAPVSLRIVDHGKGQVTAVEKNGYYPPPPPAYGYYAPYPYDRPYYRPYYAPY